MTATPRLYDDSVKGKAQDHSAELASMDDEAIYGPEFYRLGFGEAVEKGLLTDYKVLVMTVDESVAADAMARSQNSQINLTLASAMIGAWNGLAKRSGSLQGKKGGFDEDAAPMQRAVAFARDIKTSQAIADSYPQLVNMHRELLEEKAVLNDVSLHNVDVSISAQHVDGSMNALERGTKLSWLESPAVEQHTRVLTNARCLSEGVDVPALDAVIFFNPRNSMVDVVQSVGRVMRKSEGKDYGYIILPVAVAPDVSPAQALNDNARFKVVWQILNALRAHDDRFNAKVNSIALNETNPAEELPIEVDHIGKKDSQKTGSDTDSENTSPTDAINEAEADSVKNPQPLADNIELTQQLALFSLEEWQEAIYTKLVDKGRIGRTTSPLSRETKSRASKRLSTAPMPNSEQNSTALSKVSATTSTTVSAKKTPYRCSRSTSLQLRSSTRFSRTTTSSPITPWPRLWRRWSRPSPKPILIPKLSPSKSSTSLSVSEPLK